MHNIEKGLKILEENKKNCNWFFTYGVVSHLIEKIKAKQIIEIGVAYGYHCEYILQKNTEVHYLGIDPYKSNYDPNDKFAEEVKIMFGEETDQAGLNTLYELVNTKMTAYGERFKLLRNNVEEVDSKINDDSIDLIYVDGDHTYDGVIKDLNFSWKKINKEHGILCGDDYSWDPVKRACDDFFSSKNIKYSVITDFGAPSHWLYQF